MMVLTFLAVLVILGGRSYASEIAWGLKLERSWALGVLLLTVLSWLWLIWALLWILFKVASK